MKELKVYKPQYNVIVTLIYPLLFILFIVLYLIANPLTAYATENTTDYISWTRNDYSYRLNSSGVKEFESTYSETRTYNLSKSDYVFIIDGTWTHYDATVKTANLYYYSSGQLIKVSGSIDFTYNILQDGTPYNGTNKSNGVNLEMYGHSWTYVVNDKVTEYGTRNVSINALVFSSQESAIAYFETGDTSGNINKTIDMSKATYNSNIPAPKLVFNSKGGYKFSIDNASDGYYIQMKGRWYTVDDITLYKENLQWKYKYDTLLKGTLTDWVEPNEKILATAEHDLCDFNRKGYGGEAFTALLNQYPIDNRTFLGGNNAIGDKISGYTDALSNLKELHLNNPESAFNSPEIYIRFIVLKSDNTVEFGKWCHWYSNLANASGSTGYILGDSDNVAGESQSYNGLTDDELNSNEQQENPRNDSDIYTYVNSDYINQNLEISSEIANKTGTFFGLLNSMANAMGQFPQMFKDVFMFLPPWFVEFIVIAMGAIIIARFIGR